MFEQNERFRTALMQTRGINLSLSSGIEDKFRTILTPTEFIGILEHLRDEYDKAIIEKKCIYFDMDGVPGLGQCGGLPDEVINSAENK